MFFKCLTFHVVYHDENTKNVGVFTKIELFFEFHFFIFLQLKTHSMLNSINTVEERLRNAADYNIGGDNNW